MSSSPPIYYLFVCYSATPQQDPSTVFFRVEGELVAKSLVELFAKEYSNLDSCPAFSLKDAASIPLHEQILSDEALEDIGVFSDPDRGIYDPAPPQEMHLRAQYGIRASKWESLLKRRSMHLSDDAPEHQVGAGENPLPNGEKLPEMTADESQNSARILLMQFAQAYYKMLEAVISNGVAALDLELNESYIWVTGNITKMLNNEFLKDFPCEFEPFVPDLYPSTIIDLEWEDMVAPQAEQFLSAVQRYLRDKGTYDPEEKTLPWLFLEMFRPGIDTALKNADNYRKRMREHYQKVLERVSNKNPSSASSTAPPSKASSQTEESQFKHDLAFICYSHKDKKLMEELLVHLKPLERNNCVQAWSDKQIATGSQWFAEIKTALKRAKVAILMVSPHFLASEFIQEHELSVLLKESERGGLRIIWVPVAACSYKETSLQNYQAVVPPEKPLAGMTPSARNTAWVEICGEIKTALQKI